MLPFYPLPDREDQIASLALDWCHNETLALSDEEKLAWAKARINRREFLKLEKPRKMEEKLFKQLHIHKLRIEDWGRLVADVSLICAGFYTHNAGEIDPETAEQIKAEAEAIAKQFPEPTEEEKLASKRLQAKMQEEATFKKATLKENPDTSPEKIQLELEDGLAYISKKSGWVLSQF